MTESGYRTNYEREIDGIDTSTPRMQLAKEAAKLLQKYDPECDFHDRALPLKLKEALANCTINEFMALKLEMSKN